jgi:NAD(P)-dependent dehydrogenase (short-subunit alcohol dehydrogenase family)
MVLAFAHHGADVVIASRKLERCEALAREVTESTGRRGFPVTANVADWEQCDALAEVAYDEFGQVDILVNNAGMSLLYPDVSKVDEKMWDKVLGVNLKGPFRLSATIGSRMSEHDGGSIINVSSIASLRAPADAIPYAAAKAGLNALTEGFSRALGPTVRVNAIVAGPFRTDISKAWDVDAVERFARRSHSLGRVAEPPEVVGAALFFASTASSYATGSTLRLDGGAP